MTVLHAALDFVLHLDRHLLDLLMHYHRWLYAIVFAIIFAETGLVVAPFLPGDSLLFALGALAAVDAGGTLQVGWLYALLVAAAVGGNSLNYAIGRAVGARAFDGRHRFFKLEYLLRTQQFFDKHGGLAISLSRFMPIIRTFTPFVAGIGRMPLARFQLFNIAGGAAWVALFIFGGFAFGNLPVIKDNFGLVTLCVVAVSVLPLLAVAIRDHAARRNSRAGGAHRPDADSHR